MVSCERWPVQYVSVLAACWGQCSVMPHPPATVIVSSVGAWVSGKASDLRGLGKLNCPR